jgi:hypothetical protein
MDNTKKPKPDAVKEPEKRSDTSDNEQVCTKPFDSENARSKDKDGPCSNGED